MKFLVFKQVAKLIRLTVLIEMSAFKLWRNSADHSKSTPQVSERKQPICVGSYRLCTSADIVKTVGTLYLRITTLRIRLRFLPTGFKPKRQTDKPEDNIPRNLTKIIK